MKTYILTEKEIREIVYESYVCGIHDEHHSIDFSKLKESQPSISAAELREKIEYWKGCFKSAQEGMKSIAQLSFNDFCLKCYGRVVSESELLPVGYSFAQANYTQYLIGISLNASRQGKEVEISGTTHRNLCTCKHLVESYHNFCPNCGARIVWK